MNPRSEARYRPGATRADLLLLIVLAVGTAAYLWYWPRNLGLTDEGFYLYEAKRMAEGAVLYRDVWNFVAPASWYFMALVFSLFGADMAVARAANGVLHGATMALIFWSGRTIGIRRSLALAIALAYLALCQPAWPYASAHWFSSFLSVLLLLVLLRGRWAQRPGAACVPGLVNGLLIATQQQKGCIMAVGMTVLFVIDYLLAARYGNTAPWRTLVTRGGWFLAGVLIAALPFLVVAVAQAGFQPVFDALVLFPIVNYRNALSTPWGSVGSLERALAQYTFTPALKYLPVALVIPMLRAAWNTYRRQAPAEVRTTVTLSVFGLFSILSVAYFPDFIHIAFIAPVFLIAAAWTLEYAPQWVGERHAFVRAVAPLTVVLLATGVFQLGRNLWRARAEFPYAHETAFGVVDYPHAEFGVFVDTMRSAMAAAQSRELFCYPACPSLYLTTGTTNPTPFQLPLPRYRNQDHTQQILDTLEARRVPYVILIPITSKQDPVVRYLFQRYRNPTVGPLAPWGKPGPVMVFERAAEPAQDDGTF